MSTAKSAAAVHSELGLLGQTVVVIVGSAGIGLETARQAGAAGANLILTARNRERLEQVSRELGALAARHSTPRTLICSGNSSMICQLRSTMFWSPVLAPITRR